MPKQHSWALNFLWDISLILALVSRIISSMNSVQMQFQHRSVERLAPSWICKSISSLKLKNFSSASANPPAIRHGKDSSVSKSSNYLGSKSLKSISESHVSQSTSPSNRGAIPHVQSASFLRCPGLAKLCQSARLWPRLRTVHAILVSQNQNISEPLSLRGTMIQWYTTIMIHDDTWYITWIKLPSKPCFNMFQWLLSSHDGKLQKSTTAILVAWRTWTRTRDNLYQSVLCGINSKQYNLHQLASFFSRSICNHCNRILNWKMLIDAHRCSISMWIRLFEINPVEVSRTLCHCCPSRSDCIENVPNIQKERQLHSHLSNMVIQCDSCFRIFRIFRGDSCPALLSPTIQCTRPGGVQQDESQETFKLFEWTSTKENPGCQRYVQNTNEYKVNLASQSP